MRSLRNKTIHGLGWSAISQVLRQVLTFIVGVMLARLLSPREFGLVGMAAIVTGFASLFTDMGFSAAIINKLNLENRHLNAVFWVNILAGITLTLIFIACAPTIAVFYNAPILRPLVKVLALNFFLSSLYVVPSAILQKEINFRKLAIIEFIAITLSGVTAIVMALRGFGVWSLVVQSIIFTIISASLMWLLSKWRPGLSFRWGALKDLWGFSANLLGFNIFNYWSRNLDNLLIARFIGSFALGIYSRAYNLMLLPLSQISGFITRVMFPALSMIQNDTEKIKYIYLRAIGVISAVTFPLMAGLFVVSEKFIVVIFGKQWIGVVPVLNIFCLIGITQSIGTTVGWIYQARARTDIMFKWAIFSGFVYGCAFIIGLRWGIIGVAWAYFLSGYLILWYPAWSIPGRLINLKFQEMIKELTPTFLCALVMGIVVWALGLILPEKWPRLACLILQVFLGAIIYWSLLLLFRLRAYKDLCNVTSEVFLDITGPSKAMRL